MRIKLLYNLHWECPFSENEKFGKRAIRKSDNYKINDATLFNFFKVL